MENGAPMAARVAARITRHWIRFNRDNIKDLRVAWIWKSDSLVPNPQPGSETTPIMVNGILYFTMDQRRYVIAANAATGETLWVYRPNEGERFDRAPRKIHRGIQHEQRHNRVADPERRHAAEYQSRSREKRTDQHPADGKSLTSRTARHEECPLRR
jgi:hypothetical protein